ncbi:hypothetical protein [Paraconexibacter sp. AEG42_29]|uniref:hypothetical protein n=1 Tax=Paraconexibacter sp. AEG42_29 TaxID=2997339 RepID=UPI00339D7AAD
MLARARATAGVSERFSFEGGTFDELALTFLGDPIIVTHADSATSDRFRGVRASSPEGVRDRIARSLALLDGERYFAYALARLPSPTALHTVDRLEITEFVQVAGSAIRLTIEVRHVSNDVIRHDVLGHGAAQQNAETITFGGNSLTVHRHEVFDAASATDVLMHYYEHDVAPEAMTRRPLS